MTQSGDRELVLARLRRGTAAPPPANAAHPAPAPGPSAPPRFHLLDGGDALVDVFCATAADAGCGVHRVGVGVDADADAGLDAVVDLIVARHGIRAAAVTTEPHAAAAVDALRRCGVEVADAADRDAAAVADLGVTSCRAAVAVTGSVVIGSDVLGARWASLLPRVHLCVVPVDAIVATPGDVLRPLAVSDLPAALALVSGPSRTGDIEQILTRGVHGPVAVEVVVVTAG